MGAVNTNSISLAVIREITAGQLPGSGEAEYLEPNEISSFGAEITTVARQPISKYRMAKKGTITDISSSVEFSQDTTVSFLLQFLEGGIYSRWLRRAANYRKDFKVLGVGKNIVPHYRGAYAGIDAALADIAYPVAGDWWNNTVDKKEWVFDGTILTAPHFRGTFANATAAINGITNPVAGDWWNNSTDHTEWDYVDEMVPNPRYKGQFATPTAASADVADPVAGDWWDNVSDNREWVYSGEEVRADHYRGEYATTDAANKAIKDPVVGDWINCQSNNHEWNCTAINAATGYKGDFADLATAEAAIANPSAGMWFNNAQTNTEWNYVVDTFEDDGTTPKTYKWENSGNPVTTRATVVAVWTDSGKASFTRDTTVTIVWKDSGRPIGSTPKIVAQPWKSSGRAVNSTPTTITNWWRPSTKAMFTTQTETVLSAGGYNMVKTLPAALVEGTLLIARGFTNEANNGLKVVKSGGTASLALVTDTGLVTEDGNSDTSVFVCGFQGAAGDIRIDGEGNLVSTALNFLTLGIEQYSGIFIGGVAPATRFATPQNYGLCRVAKVEAHKITLDKRPNLFIADKGTGKTIHIYTGWFIHDVSVDHALFKEHTFAFEGTYPAIQDNGTDGYEYAIGNVINTLEMTLPLVDKSTATVTTFGLDVPPMVNTPQRWTRTRPLFQEAFSSSNDIVRLRLDRADGYGLSTLFKECTLTLNNNAGGENVLGKLGPAFTNYGNFDISLSFQCVFTNPEIPKMIRNNCTVTMDFCINNNDGAFWFDIPSMTLGGGDRDFTANEKVKINLTSNAFGDPYPGYTLGVTFFPYLPNPKADACA